VQSRSLGNISRCCCCFSDDLEVADHGILNQLVVQECHFVHVLGVTVDALDGLRDVPEIVGQALLVSGSYRASLCEHLGSEVFWQGVRGQHIHRHAK
jgi:hypothetical protein